MTEKEHHLWRLERFRRIRLTKKLLRPLPRKATMHRYPGLRHFSEMARKRAYLWSFKRQHITPAIYSGTILSMLPLYGVQVPLAFLLSLLLRCNFMVSAALQFLTNPLTVVPIYVFCYHIGNTLLSLVTQSASNVDIEMIEESQHTGIIELIRQVIAQARANQPGAVAENIAHLLLCTCLGGLILGLIIAVLLDLSYRLLAKRYARQHPDTAHEPDATP